MEVVVTESEWISKLKVRIHLQSRTRPSAGSVFLLSKNLDFDPFERGFDGLIVGNATPSKRDERYRKNGFGDGLANFVICDISSQPSRFNLYWICLTCSPGISTLSI
jgi:hypothetical protein